MFTVLPQDLEMVELYQDILPNRIFDAHAHLYAEGTIPRVQGPQGNFWREAVGIEDYRKDMAAFYPSVSQIHIHAIPMPDPILNERANGLRDKVNAHVSREACEDQGSAASVYVLNDDTEDMIDRMVSLPSVKAIKCYWFSAGKKDGDSCAIKEFLPESAWQISAKRGIPIVLHMMHERVLADERNYTYITQMAKRYLDARLVLAHCARAFASWTGVLTIQSLATYENIWFDMAAICEAPPIMACIKASGGKRIMWGTDYPICFFRGKPISIGKGFSWLPADSYPSNVPPTLLVTESLLALKQAATLMDLDATQLEDIFFRNAHTLFKL